MVSDVPSRMQRGFVLAVTLWMLAALAIVVGLTTLWALGVVREATAGREHIEDRAAAMATRDTLIYLAATRDMTTAGIPVEGLSAEQHALRSLDDMGGLRHDPLGDELRVDGRTYEGLGDTWFRIQDEAGLFSVVLPDQQGLDRFLMNQGVDRNTAPRLRDALLDYVDADSLERLNGAEKEAYERAGRAPPPQRRLLMPIEILNPLGWSQLPPPLLKSLPEHVTPYYSGPVDMNAVPEALLPTWVPGCPAACKAFVRRRNQAPFINSYDLAARTGIRLPGDIATDYRYMASDTLRLTTWGRTGAAWRIHVRLTPLADQAAPWAVLAAYPVSRPSDDAPPQPPQGDLFADAPPPRR